MKTDKIKFIDKNGDTFGEIIPGKDGPIMVGDTARINEVLKTVPEENHPKTPAEIII